MSFTGVRAAKPADVLYLSPRLREADKQEIQAATGQPPVVALSDGYYSSKPCLTACYRDEPIAIFGVVPVADGVGAIWMLGTPRIEQVRIPFLRQSRDWVERLNHLYPKLFNLADERNTVHLRWIEWTGFTITKRHTSVGIEGRPFVEFERNQSNVYAIDNRAG